MGLDKIDQWEYSPLSEIPEWSLSIYLSKPTLQKTNSLKFNRVINNRWFYQKATKNSQSHKQVCYKITLLSSGLFILSFLSIIEKNNLIFLILSFVWCIFFLLNFSKPKLPIKQ